MRNVTLEKSVSVCVCAIRKQTNIYVFYFSLKLLSRDGNHDWRVEIENVVRSNKKWKRSVREVYDYCPRRLPEDVTICIFHSSSSVFAKKGRTPFNWKIFVRRFVSGVCIASLLRRAFGRREIKMCKIRRLAGKPLRGVTSRARQLQLSIHYV